MLDKAKNAGGLCDIYTEETIAAAAAKDERPGAVAAAADPAEGFVRTLEGFNRLKKAHRPPTNKESHGYVLFINGIEIQITGCPICFRRGWVGFDF